MNRTNQIELTLFQKVIQQWKVLDQQIERYCSFWSELIEKAYP